MDGQVQIPSRFKKQIEFLIEIDKIKSIFHKIRIYNHLRYENDAEHAWYMSTMALILAGYANDLNVNFKKQ